MTKNELIEWIEAFKKTYAGFPKESEEACDAAISALEEIQQYREIGTVEEVRVAYKSGYDAGYIKGYDDGYALGIAQPI